MMVPRNPFKNSKGHIIIKKNDHKITDRVKNFAGMFKSHFNWINPNGIVKLFWNLLDEKFIPDPHDLNVKIAFLAGKFVIIDILLEEKKINKKEFEIFHLWYKYLCKRIIPCVRKIPDKFFGSLVSGVPIININPIIALYDKAIKLFSQNPNLKDFLLDNKIDPIEKIIKFEEHYIKLYPAFLHKCELFGSELGKYEGGKNYRNDLRRIFHLSVRNEKGIISKTGGKHKPPELIDLILNSLIHIRNAINHPDRGGIQLFSKDAVRIIDCKDSGEITYNKEYNFAGLWQVLYILTLFEIGFTTMALFIDVFKHANFIESKYKVLFLCDCYYFDNYFILSGTKFVICKRCKKPHFINDLNGIVI